jgi:regulator of protease activity HflC (stomatin/prohibitin superfamily)
MGQKEPSRRSEVFEIFGGILVLTFVLLLSGLKIVKEHNRLVIFRFGKVRNSKGSGLQMIVPFIDRAHTVDTRLMTVAIPPMEIVTKDNFHVQISAVYMSQIVDATRAVTRVSEPGRATLETAQAMLLAVLNKHSAKELVQDRHGITRSLKADLERRTRHWGIRIKSIEIKEISLPPEAKETLKAIGLQTESDGHANNGNSNHVGGISYQYHSDLQEAGDKDAG